MRAARLVLACLLGALLLVAAAAVWLLPSALDWNRYRTNLEDFASSTLGRPVTIDGPISLSLLPDPVLTAARVSVGDASAPGGGSFTVHAMRLRVALAPLFFGHIEARELVLRQPALRLPWPLPAEALTARPSWITSFSARMEDGTLTVGDVVLTGISGSLASAETGAFSAAGSARLFGREGRFTVRLTSPGPDGSVGLDVAIDGQGVVSGFGATLSGQLAGDNSMTGRIAARGPDLSQLIPAPSVPFRAEGRLTAASGLVAADDLLLEIAGSPAQGALAFRVSPVERLDLALAASRLDLDAWLPVLLRGTARTVPIGLDLSAEAGRLAGGTLRRLRAAFDLTREAATVREVSAILPGDASLRLTGAITGSTGAPRFEGDATLEAPDLHGTLDWLQAATLPRPGPSLPPGVLHHASLSAHVIATSDEVGLDKLRGEVDRSSVAGVLAVRTGAIPAIGADLTFDQVGLDPWLPSAIPPITDLPKNLGLDAHLRLAAKRASLRSETIANLAIDAEAQNGRVLLHRLDGTLRNVHVGASGVIGEDGRLADGKLNLATTDASLFADLVPARWRGTPALWRGPGALEITGSGPPNSLALRVGLDLADARLEAQPTLDLESANWSGSLTLRHPGARRLLAMLGVFGPGTTPDNAAWLGEGSLSAVAQVRGSPDRLAVDSFDLRAGALHAGGGLSIEGAGAIPRIAGRITAETLPIPLPDAQATDPLPFAALHGWEASLRIEAGEVLAGLMPAVQNLACDVSVSAGVLRIERLTARTDGGALSGSLAVDSEASPPALLVDASLKDAIIAGPLFDLPLDLKNGRAEGSLRLTASGYSPAALLATLAGGGRLSASEGTLIGFDLAKVQETVGHAETGDFPVIEAALRDALSSGTTAFDRLDLDASAASGSISLRQGRLSAGTGQAAFAGTLALTTGSLDLSTAIRPAIAEGPEIGLHLTGPLSSLRSVPELSGVARWLADHTQ